MLTSGKSASYAVPSNKTALDPWFETYYGPYMYEAFQAVLSLRFGTYDGRDAGSWQRRVAHRSFYEKFVGDLVRDVRRTGYERGASGCVGAG